MENRAQAVCNAGGLGVVGGAFVTPDTLRTYLRELKEALVDKSTPFGVDLLLPQVGGGARATNKDYTRGTIHELVDIMIEEGCTLFVCAVGVRHTLRTGGSWVFWPPMVGHLLVLLPCAIVCPNGDGRPSGSAGAGGRAAAQGWYYGDEHGRLAEARGEGAGRRR
jgi:hypothetical protein